MAQKSFNEYVQCYPIGDDPNIRYMTSYTSQEKILFEANPIVRYSFYNNFVKELMKENNIHSHACYFNFKPQLRMYNDNSKPVRMPSYKILLGTQHLFRIKTQAEQKQAFIGFSLESGHYSNGQDGSAFSEKYADDSKESDSIYNTITDATDLSKILNRKSGNFSTNLSELILNYRCYDLDDLMPSKMHSINLGYTLYHNRFLGLADFGGYTQNDIKIYGRHRFLGSYEYMQVLKKYKDKRFSIKQTIEFIQKPHPSVEPFRTETTFTYYPFPKSKTFGFMASYIYGHDNYNFRFVDTGHQVSFGLTWSQFPLVQMKGGL
jgi:hypothetical protein